MNYKLEKEEANAKGTLILMLEDDTIVARMTYSRIDENNVIVDHTAVDPNAKGKGHGRAIVEEMVKWARENDQKILPLCPFTKGVLEKHPEWQDILR